MRLSHLFNKTKPADKNQCKLCHRDLNKVQMSVNYPTLICYDCAFAERMRVRSNNKRRRNKRNPTGRVRTAEWMMCLAQHNYGCATCGRQGRINLTMDHVLPLFSGGANTSDNTQPLCVPCHETKDGHKRKPGWLWRRWWRRSATFVRRVWRKVLHKNPV